MLLQEELVAPTFVLLSVSKVIVQNHLLLEYSITYLVNHYSFTLLHTDTLNKLAVLAKCSNSTFYVFLFVLLLHKRLPPTVLRPCYTYAHLNITFHNTHSSRPFI